VESKLREKKQKELLKAREQEEKHQLPFKPNLESTKSSRYGRKSPNPYEKQLQESSQRLKNNYKDQ